MKFSTGRRLLLDKCSIQSEGRHSHHKLDVERINGLLFLKLTSTEENTQFRNYLVEPAIFHRLDSA